METVTLHSEDFKTVHNTLCELRTVQERLTGVISQQLADQLHRVVKGFEQGLADAYRQDSDAFDRKNDHYEEQRLRSNLRSIWSIYEVEELGDQHPYGDIREICYRDHWGDRAVYETVEGGTWMDLYEAADRCIQRSGDGHHVFIESFEAVADQPHQLRLTTGS